MIQYHDDGTATISAESDPFTETARFFWSQGADDLISDFGLSPKEADELMAWAEPIMVAARALDTEYREAIQRAARAQTDTNDRILPEKKALADAVLQCEPLTRQSLDALIAATEALVAATGGPISK